MEEHRDRPVVGADLHDRPGVPMETPPHKLTPTAPDAFERQKPRRGIVHRRALKQMTPVFGTVQPVHGLSGLLRRVAYGTRETRARHWMLLLIADRVDVWEHRIAKLVKVAALVPAGAAAVVIAIKYLRD
jgi:hypothetical protein